MSSAFARRRRQLAKLVRLLPRAEWRRGLTLGVAASVEHRDVIAGLDIASVVDAGANIGQFSLLVSVLQPHARIFAFEPLPVAADRYERLFAGNSRVRLHRAALGPERGEAVLHVSARNDSSSLLPISDAQERIFPGTREVGTVAVPVGPLGDFVSRAELVPPALLKIDVQGFELEVLRGAAALLDAFAWLYVEASWLPLYEGQALAGEVMAFVEARGFVAAGAFNRATTPDGTPIQADLLFRRADHC
jgi:FkbM family methyltransferase